MSLTTYTASVPVFIRLLSNLSFILEKAEQQATEKKFSTEALLQARLYPDMFPLARQVQIACDNAKNGLARIAQAEFPRFEDTEKTFAELRTRIAQTIAFLQTLSAEAFDGSEQRPIEHVIPNFKTYHFPNGDNYLTTWVMPNVYFHVTTAYAILRHNGIQLGKADYLAGAAQA